MTLKGKDIIGLPIALSSTHEGVDAIEDILFDSHKRQVVGFLLKHLDISSERRVLKIKDVASFENECVLVDGEHRIKNAYEAGDVVAQIVHAKSFLSQVHAKCIDGVMLGTLFDICFDSKSGMVEQFEIEKENSDVRYTVWECQVDSIDKNSIYIDFQKSPSFPVIKGGQASQLQQDTALTAEGNKKNGSQSQENGLLKNEFARIISQFKKTLQSYEEELKKAQKNNQSPGDTDMSFDSHGTFFDENHKNKPQVSASDPHTHEAAGKYLTKNILLENDEMFAKKGEIITHNMLHEAEEKNVLIELLANSSTQVE